MTALVRPPICTYLFMETLALLLCSVSPPVMLVLCLLTGGEIKLFSTVNVGLWSCMLNRSRADGSPRPLDFFQGRRPLAHALSLLRILCMCRYVTVNSLHMGME